MKKIPNLVLIWMFGILAAGIPAAQTGNGQSPAGPQRMQDRISREVRYELVMLPHLIIFENLQYKVDGAYRDFTWPGSQECFLSTTVYRCKSPDGTGKEKQYRGSIPCFLFYFATLSFYL